MVNYSETGEITDEQRAKAHVKTAAEARQVLRRIGYPAMIKASEGGGGKGIRKVTREEDVEAAFRQVRTLAFLFSLCELTLVYAGRIRDPRRISVCHEISAQRASPRSPSTRRSVRRCHRPLQPRLLRTETTPKDH